MGPEDLVTHPSESLHDIFRVTVWNSPGICTIDNREQTGCSELDLLSSLVDFVVYQALDRRTSIKR